MLSPFPSCQTTAMLQLRWPTVTGRVETHMHTHTNLLKAQLCCTSILLVLLKYSRHVVFPLAMFPSIQIWKQTQRQGLDASPHKWWGKCILMRYEVQDGKMLSSHQYCDKRLHTVHGTKCVFSWFLRLHYRFFYSTYHTILNCSDNCLYSDIYHTSPC